MGVEGWTERRWEARSSGQNRGPEIEELRLGIEGVPEGQGGKGGSAVWCWVIQ